MVAEIVIKEMKERLNVGKVLILGASGMVGSRFLEFYGGDFLIPTHDQVDITDREAVAEFIQCEKPDFIVNFAAYTNVGEAEKQRPQGTSIDKNGECWKLNVEGVRNILDVLEPQKTHFIQISTDMVFSGLPEDPGPYTEGHPAETDPEKLTWYGYTKAEAERLVQERLGDKATIIRIIYPVRKEFAKKMDYLRFPLAKYQQEGKLYPLFTDQQVSITFIDDFCSALRKIIGNKLTGVFHVSSPDTTTPYKLISKFLGKKLREKPHLEEGKVMNPRRYPLKGGLNPKKTEKKLGMQFSTIDKIIDQLSTS